MIGVKTKPMTRMSVFFEGPTAVMASRAVMMSGMARIASTTRIVASSTNPR
jgi:histidinol dehydrogenase